MKKRFFKILFVAMSFLLLISAIILAVSGSEAIITDATFSSVIMNVGADETQRNLTWYSQYNTSAEVHYAKSQDGTFPSDYSVSKATCVKATKAGYYSYKATLSGLEESSSYVYRLVVGATQSDTYSFKVYDFEGEFSFAFAADPQTSSSANGQSWTDTLNKIKNSFDGVSFVVSGGDQTSDPTAESNFDAFISEHLSSLAIATTVGPPHDNSTLYADHYNLPNLSSCHGVTNTSSDYFYKYGNVLFMHLNVENANYDDHVTFMQNAIKNNPDCTWKIAILHFSFFSGGNHSTDTAVKNFRSALAPKFCELGIDVVLSGHDHIYSRSQLMLDGTTVSSDTVTNGVVTDPEGTLYLCGTSASGSGYYDKEQTDDDDYIACLNDEDRKGIVIFKASEGSLSLKAYFVDGSTPEEIDSFTINKTPARVILKDDMLAITENGESYQPLVNAYNYESAEIKVINGYWSISTDGGNSFDSLNIPADSSRFVLRINSDNGYWELSENGGTSFTMLSVSSRTYTVTYVTDPSVEIGDEYDPSLVSVRRFTESQPDAPALSLPTGSISEGNLYDWSWTYCLNGNPVSEFSYGESYTAYLCRKDTPVSSTMYIGAENIPEDYTYTWATVWEYVRLCQGESITLKLSKSLTVPSVTFTVPINLTLDLNGNTLTSSSSKLFVFEVGSTGSTMAVISSAAGGGINTGTNNLFYLGSNHLSLINLKFGSATSSPITFSGKYMVYSGGNFKRGSTLNLEICNGNYTVSDGVIYTNNVNSDAVYNTYKLTLTDSDFKFSGSSSSIVHSAYCASSNSFINADGCSFTDTYKSDNSSSRYLIREDNWYGSVSFTSCDLVGMSIGADLNGSAITKASSIVMGEGCTFKNSASTFNKENPISFYSSKVKAAEDCVIARTDSIGSAEIITMSAAVPITWANPIGYTDYWKKNTTPAYLGESEFTVGSVTYSLMVNEEITSATEPKSYPFASSEGYLYRYDSENKMWQISTDGGASYRDLTTSVAPEAPTSACRVTVDGVSTDYDTTNFSEILSVYNSADYKNKEINITLGEDLTYSAASTFSKASGVTINIDLAGHTLTLNSNGKMAFSASGFTLRIYSSEKDGELILANASDTININAQGTVIIGSEEYKNNLTVTSKQYFINMATLSNGSTVNVSFLYSDFTFGSFGLLRLNALGSAAVTLNTEIVGCTVKGGYNVLCYNASSNLSASGNGGVFTKESSITAKDTAFKCTSSSVKDFFGHANFTDRYFGTASFVGCSFDGYELNGELILSDEALSYNSYYSTLTDYDPLAAITVGGGCEFKNYGSTFNSAKDSFSASNISTAEKATIVANGDSVSVIDSYSYSVSIDGTTTYYYESADFSEILSVYNSADYKNKEINITLGEDLTYSTASTFSKASGVTINIDLAGHTLTLNSNGKLVFSASGFTLRIYSSEKGGELILANASDTININAQGTVTIGSEEYKNNLTVTSKQYFINMATLSNGSTVNVSFLYSDFTFGSFGLLRLNALGSAAVTLNTEIVGCTVKGGYNVLCYNASSNLSASGNGGVFTKESSITAKDTAFKCNSSSVKDFFGHANFTDRYFGTASFVDCSFDGYELNGDLILSNEALSYNSYYSTLTDYDPLAAITVGGGCEFKNFGNTFNSAKDAFSAQNVSTAEGSVIAYTETAVLILDSSKHPLSDWIYENGRHWKECLSCNDGIKFNHSACTDEESCDVCGNGKVNIDTKSFNPLASLTLYTHIEYNVYIPVRSEIKEIKLDGTVYTDFTSLKTVTLSEKQYYKLSIPLGATQAMRDIELQLMITTESGDEGVGNWLLTVEKYSTALLNGDYTELEKRLVKDILSYIRSAYVYFSDSIGEQSVLEVCAKIDALIGEDYDSTSTTDIASATPKYSVDGLASAALSINDAPTFIFTPKTDEDGNLLYSADSYHFYINSEECDFEVITLSDGRIAFFLDIYAYMIISDVSYTVDGTDISGEYNLKSYYDYAIESNDENLVRFVERLCRYSETASEYYSSLD